MSKTKPTTTGERLIVIEEQLDQNAREHTVIIQKMECIDQKLDKAIETKADQKDLDSINSKLWAFVMIVITAFVGLLVWLIQGGQ